mgnify:CR=1 FL=1
MKTNEKLQIIVIDTNNELHETYKSYFKDTNYELSGFYENVGDAILDFDYAQPDIIISEATVKNIFEKIGLSFFKSKNPNIKIIMVSVVDDFEVIKKAFMHGASGYLTKPVNKDRIQHALESLEREGAAISNDVAKKLILMFQRKSQTIFSKRENQIIDHLRQGATYKIIAQKLFVTTSAINFHIQNIYLKLNVNSKSEALLKLQEIG